MQFVAVLLSIAGLESIVWGPWDLGAQPLWAQVFVSSLIALFCLGTLVIKEQGKD